jgi:hypothetical protein
VWKSRNWRYRELLLESHPPPGDEWGEWADSGEPPGGASGEPHYGHNGYDGYNHGYNYGHYDANHRHNYCHYCHYCHYWHDGCANRDDDHPRRYHIAAGYYYSADHDGGADQPIPVHRLPDG